MREVISASEGHRITSRNVTDGEFGQRCNLKLTGTWTLERVDKRTGRTVRVDKAHNTIQSAGITEFLELCTGDSTAHFDSGAFFKVYDGDPGTEVFSAASADAAPVHLTEQVTWTFSDISVDTYTAARIEFGLGALTFSNASVAFGAKPNTQNWIYRYELSISSGDAPLSESDGLDHMLRLFTGDKDEHFNNAATALKIYEDQSFTELNGAGNGSYTLGQDTSFPSVSGSDMVLQWVVPAGTLTGTWEGVEIYTTYGNGDDATLRSPALGVWDSLGSKTASSKWQYTYTFSLT